MKKELKGLMFNELTNELDKFENNNLYKCPCCGKTFGWDDVNYYPEESIYTCPECFQTLDENQLQIVTALDYIEQVYLCYRVSNKKEFANE